MNLILKPKAVRSYGIIRWQIGNYVSESIESFTR